MKRLAKSVLAALILLPLLSACVSGGGSRPDEQRAAVNRMANDTLARLYRAQPHALSEVQNAEGYAVFSGGELAVLWVSAGYAHGLAHDNKSGQDIYMQMAKAGAGLGLGAKDYDTVFIFNNHQALRSFITEGLDLSGTADATAKADEKGQSFSGGADVLPGVRIYQLTGTGLLAQAMVQGTKYWLDDALNPPGAERPRPSQPGHW